MYATAMSDWHEDLASVRAALVTACRDPESQQRAFLAGLLDRAAGGTFAREHRLEPGLSIAEYQARAPIRSVQDFQDYVYRAYEGEPDVLFPGKPIFFAQTSGTTGRPKLIAFSRHVRAAARTFLFSINASVPEELISSGFWMMGKHHESTSPMGVPVGGAAGFMRHSMQDVPCYGGFPHPLAELTNAEARNYGILRLLLARPLLHLVSLNPSSLIALFDQLRTNASALAADLRDGGLARGPALARDALADIALPPAPSRADAIEAWIAAGAAHVTDLWPELRRVTTWQEGSLKLYFPKLADQLPGVEFRRLPAGASEGHGMTTPPSGNDVSVPSLLCGFYEFVPADEEPSNSNTRLVHELEAGREYRIVISNDRGLYRALTDDVFRVEGFEDRAPVLLFLQRHGLTSSMTGEKLTEPHAAAALTAAMATLRAYPPGAQLVPEWRDSAAPRYAITLELAAPEERGSLVEFLRTVETTLRAQNPEYAAKRDSRRLAAPVLLVLSPGSFERRKAEFTSARNRSDTQYKLPPLVTAMLERAKLQVVDELVDEG